MKLKDKHRLARNQNWHSNGINHAANEMTGQTTYITTNYNDGSIDSVESDADYNICLQYSHTPGDLSNCLKLSRLRNVNWLDPGLKCVGKLCNRDVNGIRKGIEKRNLFCSRYGCKTQTSKRVFCNRHGCGRSIRKAMKASTVLLKKRKNNSCDTVTGCRWIHRKVSNMSRRNTDINKETFEEKTELDDANIPSISRSFYKSTPSRNTYEKLHMKYMKLSDITGNLEPSSIDESADNGDSLRRIIGSLCISGRMSCLVDKVIKNN